MFGEVTGVSTGDTYANRRALYDAGVHRALQAGIVGRAADGAESIVLAGGYVDDEDYGDDAQELSPPFRGDAGRS